MKYKCDNCSEVFAEEEVVLKDFGNNFHIFGQSVMVKNKNTGKVCRTSTDKIEEGDCSIHCPKCDQVHLFGFDRAYEEVGAAA